MKAKNDIESAAARMILDRGVRYKTGEGEGITIRPLRFGTCLSIAERIAGSGLTEEAIKKGGTNVFAFFAEYGMVMADCIAMAELNARDAMTAAAIARRTEWYRDNLTTLQLYELFAHVLTVSGVTDFTTTISLLLTMSRRMLSPREEGS